MKWLLIVLMLALPMAARAQSESPEGFTVTNTTAVVEASTTPGTAAPTGPFTTFQITNAGCSNPAPCILRNGAVDSVTANVVELYYHNHTTYQLNSAGNWYSDITGVNGWQGPVASPVPGGGASNFQPDLSNAAAHPVTGVPASKVAYSISLFPNNVIGQSPDTSASVASPIWNTYFGSLALSRPVVNLGTGCSCDNSNGAQTDDNNFMTAWTAYANGQVSGGYSISGSQQPLGNDWHSWGSFSENPNGTLNPNGTIKSGQQTYWSTLLFTPGVAPAPGTVWNSNDQVGMTLTNNNLTATSAATGVSDARTTNGKSTGKFCWEITANTVTVDFGMGLTNGSYVLGNTNGLGSDANGLGFYSGKANPNAQIVFFNGSLVTSGTAQASANGERITECHDFDAQLDWVTDSAMRTNSGTGAWNNSGTCNPTVASCGISTSGMTCPCFIAYHNRETGVAALNTSGSFAVALPSGFQTFDQPVVSTTRPMVVILGQNGEYHLASLH